MADLKRSSKDLVSEAKAQIENLTPEQLERELQRGAVLVDLRDASERRQQGVIPGAVHVNRGMLEFHADPSTTYHNPALDPERRVILHCAAGGRSALAAKTLKDMGYRDVAHLEGGITAWKEQGKPVEEP